MSWRFTKTRSDRLRVVGRYIYRYANNWRAKRAILVVQCARFFCYYWQAGASQLNRTTGPIFLLYRARGNVV